MKAKHYYSLLVTFFVAFISYTQAQTYTTLEEPKSGTDIEYSLSESQDTLHVKSTNQIYKMSFVKDGKAKTYKVTPKQNEVAVLLKGFDKGSYTVIVYRGNIISGFKLDRLEDFESATEIKNPIYLPKAGTFTLISAKKPTNVGLSINAGRSFNDVTSDQMTRKVTQEEVDSRTATFDVEGVETKKTDTIEVRVIDKKERNYSASHVSIIKEKKKLLTAVNRRELAERYKNNLASIKKAEPTVEEIEEVIEEKVEDAPVVTEAPVVKERAKQKGKMSRGKRKTERIKLKNKKRKERAERKARKRAEKRKRKRNKKRKKKKRSKNVDVTED